MAKFGKTKYFRVLRLKLNITVIGLFIALLGTLSPTQAQSDGGMGPIEAISSGIGRLISGITSINIESATLGIDKGIIAGAVIGLGRTVERNPFPTGKHDQFLVKDRMRLGYELGAGFIVGGTVSYVQEWTLVYPVPTSLKGTLSRKFLVDLFLPLTVKRLEESQLPQEYALIRESYFEGKGRVKLGGAVPFMVGNQATLGRVQLTSLITKREKDGPLKIAREYSHFTRFTYELWMNLVLFDLPVFDAYKNSGKVVRNYISLKNAEIKPRPRIKLLEALFSGKDEETLNNFLGNENVYRRVESDYSESYAGVNFFGIFNKETFLREDYVTDTVYSGSEATTTQWWQYLDRHYHDWTTGLQSELYRSDIFLSGVPLKDRNDVVVGIEKPQLRLKLKISDEETTEEEYEEDFQELAYTLSPAQSPLVLDRPRPYPKNPLKIFFTLEIHLEEDHLEQLKGMGEKIWYDALEEVTGRNATYWKRAAENGYHSRDRSRLRQTRLPLNEVHLAKKTKTILRYLEKARKHQKKKPMLSLRYLSWSLRKMFNVGNSAWDIRLLHALKLKLTRPYWIGAKVEIFNETTAPTQIDRFAATSGKSNWNNRPEYNFILQDPSEIYFFFEDNSFL